MNRTLLFTGKQNFFKASSIIHNEGSVGRRHGNARAVSGVPGSWQLQPQRVAKICNKKNSKRTAFIPGSTFDTVVYRCYASKENHDLPKSLHQNSVKIVFLLFYDELLLCIIRIIWSWCQNIASLCCIHAHILARDSHHLVATFSSQINNSDARFWHTQHCR